MAGLQNIDPKDNPLAIAVKLDTVINGVALNPGETYTVTGPTFIGGVHSNASSQGLNVLRARPKNSNIKMIHLENNASWFYSIHFPTASNPNFLYLVPTKYNSMYEDNHEEMTQASQLDQVFSTSTPFTWRQAARNWVAAMVGFIGGAGANSPVGKRLGFTFVGDDTNNTSEIASFEIRLNFLT